jgi:DNA-binding MltR family transcriptional regulator
LWQQLFDPSEMQAFADEANTFTKQLMEESDRGAALVGLAYLDELLKRLCEAKMLASKATKALLNYPGALSTAAARTDLAYSIGWIGPETYQDLVTLRRIRNKFAHAHEVVTFSDESVQKLCSELISPRALLPARFPKDRDKFLITAQTLVMRLEYFRQLSKTPRPGRDPPLRPIQPETEKA